MKMPKRRQKQRQKRKKKQKIVKLDTVELEGILRRAEAELDKEDYELLKALVESYVYVTNLVEDKSTTIARLRKLLFGSSSEKTSDVLETAGDDTAATAGQETAAEDGAASTPGSDQEHASEPPKREGHGRNGADDYRGAERVPVPHGSLKSGDRCPDCQKGKVYELARPGLLVRVVGQAPVQAKVYELQKLRCNLCGKVFTAEAPAGVGTEKYDATAASMIALLKYGSGLPFNRLEGLQGSLGIPLPASTQWDIVSDTARMIAPAYHELIRQAAQGEVLYNDDTTVKILELMGKRARAKVFAEAEGAPEHAKDAPKRTGIFTSGIVSTNEGRRIALFFSGRRHAGENLAEVLRHRAADLSAPIQMCDALSRNDPREFKTILANLGEAIEYMLKHWEKLTLFLRESGAPLDNNITERALKRAILHRKNALFYMSENGAHVGDMFMSLIHTCQLNEVNSFDYVTELQRHAADLAARPENWMPWNYRETLEPADTTTDAARD